VTVNFTSRAETGTTLAPALTDTKMSRLFPLSVPARTGVDQLPFTGSLTAQDRAAPCFTQQIAIRQLPESVGFGSRL
jgi:hypothetical protein